MILLHAKPIMLDAGRSSRREAGFTLIETLVALLIMGVATAAILILISQNTRFMAQSEERLLASIIADNIMVETLADRQRLELGTIEETVSMGGREWLYERDITETTLDRLFVVSIRVRRAGSPQVQAELTTVKSER